MICQRRRSKRYGRPCARLFIAHLQSSSLIQCGCWRVRTATAAAGLKGIEARSRQISHDSRHLTAGGGEPMAQAMTEHRIMVCRQVWFTAYFPSYGFQALHHIGTVLEPIPSPLVQRRGCSTKHTRVTARSRVPVALFQPDPSSLAGRAHSHSSRGALHTPSRHRGYAKWVSRNDRMEYDWSFKSSMLFSILSHIPPDLRSPRCPMRTDSSVQGV